MKLYGITDPGLVRTENQDTYATSDHQETGHTICVVCDGMGGAAGGRLASQIAVDSYTKTVLETLEPEMTIEQLQAVSTHAVATANLAIQQKAKDSESYQNMGTTLVSAISYPGGVVITNVGDSRAYHLTPQKGIVRITKDHSLVERMVDRGDITEEEARRHPQKNLITRALGPDTNAQSDTFVCPLEPDDYILLCSDGLVNTVTDQEMLFEIVHGDSLDNCLDRLLSISKSRGASDNVTAVLMQNR